MNPLTTRVLTVMLVAGLGCLTAPAQGTDRAEAAFQAAYEKEMVDGDLKAAIAQYEKLARGTNRAVVAKALVRIGQCQEKLGSAEARKAYERVVKEFGDQPSAVEARGRLAALGSSVGAPKTIYSDGHVTGPRPNRDGTFVAAICGEALCVFDTSSGKRSTVVAAPGERGSRHWRPLPSPDGRSLAYVHFSDRGGSSFAELRVKGPAGEVVLASGLKDTFSPVDWTADGKTVLFARIDAAGKAGLFLIPAIGGTAQAVQAPDFDWSTGRDNSKISPDGKWLAYSVAKRAKQGGGYVPTDVVVIPMGGGQPQVVLDGPGHERVVGWVASGDLVVTSDRTSKVLPYKLRIVNGQRTGDPELLEKDLGEAQVAGVSMRNGSLFLATGVRQTELHAFTPDMKSSKKFRTGYQASVPAFSPDGKMLAYASGPVTGNNAVVIQDVATGAERRLPVEIPRILRLGWYPNSRHVFAIVNEGNWDDRRVFRFNVQTGEMKPLPNVTGMSAYFSPAILADGKTLIYCGREKLAVGEAGILIALDTETGERKPFLRAQAPYSGIGSFALSPDRRRIVYMQYNPANRHSALSVATLPSLESKVVQSCERPECNAMTPYFAPDQESILFWMGRENAPDQAGLALLRIGSDTPVVLKKHPFTPDGPAFHPVTGEMILGTSTFVSELRMK